MSVEPQLKMNVANPLTAIEYSEFTSMSKYEDEEGVFFTKKIFLFILHLLLKSGKVFHTSDCIVFLSRQEGVYPDPNRNIY